MRSAFDFSSFNTKPNIRWISLELRPEFKETNCRHVNIDIVDICSESYWVKQYSLSVIMYEVCRLMDSEYKSLGTYDVTHNVCVQCLF